MSAIRAALGGKHTFENNGQTFDVKLIEQQDKLNFQAWLEKRARASIIAMKDEVPVDVWREAWSQVNSDIAAGLYSFHSPTGEASIATVEGMCGLAALLFTDQKTKRQPTVSQMVEMFVMRMDELAPFLEMIFRESAMEKNARTPAVPQPPAEGQTGGE